jgi:hypothetical protein
MFGLETLNVLSGLVTVYLVFALACTAIVEAFAAWLKVRSKNLEAALGEFLAGHIKQGETFVEAFYKHPIVQALSKGQKGRPSYIPPEIVGQVVEGLVTANSAAKSLTDAVNSLPGTPETNRIKGLLDAFVKQANGDLAVFRKAVETHFDTLMDRVSGWVKRYSQTAALIVSAALVMGANVDTVDIASSLATSPSMRAKMVEIADQRLAEAKSTEGQVADRNAEGGVTVKEAKKQTETARAALDQATSDMESAGLRFGWKD